MMTKVHNPIMVTTEALPIFGIPVKKCVTSWMVLYVTYVFRIYIFINLKYVSYSIVMFVFNLLFNLFILLCFKHSHCSMKFWSKCGLCDKLTTVLTVWSCASLCHRATVHTKKNLLNLVSKVCHLIPSPK